MLLLLDSSTLYLHWRISRDIFGKGNRYCSEAEKAWAFISTNADSWTLTKACCLWTKDFYWENISWISCWMTEPLLKVQSIVRLEAICIFLTCKFRIAPPLLLPRSASEMLMRNKIDGNTFWQTRRSDHFTKLLYSKCFLRISISHAGCYHSWSFMNIQFSRVAILSNFRSQWQSCTRIL